MNWLAIVAALIIGIGTGFMICAVLTLGRVDDVLHALALLIEDYGPGAPGECAGSAAGIIR